VIIWLAANIPADSKGGVSRSMAGLSEGLRQRGHSTVLVTARNKGSDNYLVFALNLCLRLLLHRGNPPDWIIARSSDGVFCALAAKAFALKTMIALHNHGWEEIVGDVEKRLPHRLVAFPTTWKARILRLPLLRVSLSLCDCCFSGTIAEIRWLAKKYPNHRHKMRYLPNGVHVDPDNAWEEPIDAPPHFLSVGNDTWKKNLGHVIAVFRELRKKTPEARLFLVGTGDSVVTNVDFTGDDHGAITVVTEEDPQRMSRWYGECPYYISCSRYEGGHSFALLEAMSHGCVVFASAIPSTMEIIRNEVNGMLIGGVEPELDGLAVQRALYQKELIGRLRRNARSTAGRNRWDRQVSRLEKTLCLP
jgi:glycosyltransferase involved in cell wall biosynthesis